MAGQIKIMPGNPSTGTDPSVTGQPDPDCLGPIVPKSLTNSTVILSASSPDACWTPGTSQTFCFQTDTFTPDWEYVYYLWLRFPADWTVTNVTVDGTPSCTGGGTWGTFSWGSYISPYEVRIAHSRYQAYSDHCTATYCVTVTTGAGSGDAPVSWYWDGDGYGGAPHHPCSSDVYTPSMATEPCDQAVNPPASIPAGGAWTTVAASAPPAWNGNGYPCSGCTAQNGAAQWVTYLIGDQATIAGFWGYNHATNAWFNPGAAGTPSNRWAPNWAYDPATNRCYLTGGATAPGGGNITQAYMFDPVANSFTALPSFTTARAFHGSWVGTIDGTKYLAIGGGVDASSNVWTSTQCYNLDTMPGAWAAENATMGPYPVGKWGAAYGRLAGPGGSQFWVASGADAGFALSDTAHYFDDADNLWHAAGNTGALVYRTSGTVSGSDFYIVGGSTGGFTPTSGVRKYSGGVWGPAPSMPHARMDLVTGVGANGNIWVVDGYGPGGANYVDYLTACGGCPTITLAPTTLPGGIVGTYYNSGWINASGGTAAYSLAVLSGALPPGIGIHQVSATNFELIGTPTAAGTTTFTLEATDMNGCKGSQEYTVEMVCPTITLSPLPSPILNVPYTQTITATGGTGPYTFALTAGALPTGFNLAADGTVTGTLITLGDYSFTVTATDSLGCTGEQAYSMATFSTFFLDDAGRSKLCVNRLTGEYTWEITTCPGMGTYTGVANILNGGTKIYSKPGAPEYLNCTYDPIRKRASGYFMTAAGDYSRLTDLNTANNIGGCP
jgi:hypothetical protein